MSQDDTFCFNLNYLLQTGMNAKSILLSLHNYIVENILIVWYHIIGSFYKNLLKGKIELVFLLFHLFILIFYEIKYYITIKGNDVIIFTT